MEWGGIFEESKLSVYEHIPKAWTPKTFTLPSFKERNALASFMNTNQLQFPLIVKPDRGMRGKGVRFHQNLDSLLNHCQSSDSDQAYIVQPYVDLPHEIGVFVIKSEVEWYVTSLMQRELPSVTGNSFNTIEELIRQDDFLFLQLERIRSESQIDLERIPGMSEVVNLGKVGNHRLGTRFNDRSDLLSPELTMAMQRICDLLKGFEYGRLDIRFKNWESFLQLRDFAIIEVNGANSEPGHIYQEGFGLWKAWKVLLKHHKIIFHKAKKAHEAGQSAPDFVRSVSLFRQYLRTMKLS